MLAKVRQVIAPVSSLGNYPEARAFRATVEFIGHPAGRSEIKLYGVLKGR
jgi:hypothetical protein